ncbi:GNAT family N-acetyltransferase [archaeon]|nr:GNAT family N-acetyltransferase [archaeon]
MEIRSPKTKEEWKKYYDIRYRILRKPYGAPKGEEKKPEDAIADHRAIFLGGNMIGIGMIYDDKGNARIRFIAIDEKYQKRGFGKIMMEELEKSAKEKGYRKIVLWGDEPAVKFYEKLGYKNTGKGPMIFGKIQQYNMGKKI